MKIGILAGKQYPTRKQGCVTTLVHEESSIFHLCGNISRRRNKDLFCMIGGQIAQVSNVHWVITTYVRRNST